ncbi:chemotaxis protein CheA [Cesiribacter andamanensis]|uniref:Chemotaxis protein CheA n=1 Tax=Cesiribacter andamanensis AMV16 TaxID=1279009 RepID=M7NQH8_9BACT|nr:chemotaxis protein CheA [Cesiribacter andamanensis]EMR03980.1 Chemotaxis protein CheA [Cesiribacter andamanensis AMV16]
MIEHLKQKYLEEAHDLLLELEQTLLLLEQNPAAAEGVETAFRVMHTLKGSSGMFGYQQIGELVHLLESGYDAIRASGSPFPHALLNLSLEAVDHIRLLLDAAAAATEACQTTHRLLLKRAAEMLYEVVPATDSSTAPTRQELTSWALLFAPQADLFKNGTNPLYILEDLASLGQLHTFADTQLLPPAQALDPRCCYLSWKLLLVTDAPESDIRDCFLFVEGSCRLELHPLGPGNCLSSLSEPATAELARQVREGLSWEQFLEQLQQPGAAVAAGPGQLPTADSLPEAEGGAAGLQTRGAASIRVASDKLDDLMNLVSELVANQERLSLLAELSLQPELAGVAEEIEKITRQLRDKTFDICLVPIGSMLTRFKRLVRDLSQELNKNIVFEAEGVETELDKNVIQNLSDCLVHIFRNSIDHGIEGEQERLRKGKPAQGKIVLKAYTSGTNVVIEVQDDGAGIDLQKVQQKALQKGLIGPEDTLSEQEVLELLFMPGFSTAQGVTAVSGRGVGMDVVRRNMRELRGEVTLSSRQDAGTTLTLTLPLTISIIDGLMVRIGDTDFVLPLSFVEKSYSITPGQLSAAFNNQLVLDGEPMLYANLADAFGCPGVGRQSFGVVVKTGQQKMLLLVDAILGEYQAVLKPLGRFYLEQDFLSGGSLKGDGTVALVIDPQKLIQDIIQKTAISI